jgi:AraC-like DNA-binding protein
LCSKIIEIEKILLYHVDVKNNLYEKLNYKDYTLPIIYHLDILDRAKNKTTFGMHWHDSIEILYFIEGSARVKCDYSNRSVGPGDVFIINTNQLHTVNLVSEKCVYHCFILPEKLFAGNINLYKYNFENLISSNEYLNGLLGNIIREISEKNPEYKMAAKGCLYQLFSYLIRHYVKEEGNNAKQNTIDIIKNSLIFIEDNYDRQLSLVDICSRSNLSKYYFCRVFKEAVGKSPIQYLNFIRVMKAAQLLQSGGYNVIQTSEACGFNNYNYFSKVFKRNMNILPKEVKKYSNGLSSKEI